MANSRALYSIGASCLGFLCFVIAAIAVGLPTWGYYYNRENANFDQGYFGPWRVCKKLLYNREKCGNEVARFRTTVTTYIAGIVASIGVASLGIYCVLSVLQMAMISSKETVAMKYTHALMIKLALALLATLLSVVAAGLFAVQIDDGVNRGYYVTRGEAFYVQILCIIVNVFLFVLSLYDCLYSRKAGGDPTGMSDAIRTHTVHSPQYKERPTVSMTDASGRPYNGHGSIQSVSTTMTGLSSDYPHPNMPTRSPLRSSLKKPRATQGIQNPGYTGSSSPTPGRNGTQKKVRIQTQTTEV